jgi:hypothetical protein
MRKTTENTNDSLKFYIPDITEVVPGNFKNVQVADTSNTNGNATVTFTLTSPIPPYAYYVIISRTINILISYYIQWAADAINYFKTYNSAGVPNTDGAYGSAPYISISLNNFVQYGNDNAGSAIGSTLANAGGGTQAETIENVTYTTPLSTEGVLVGYQFQPGDRIRLIYDQFNTNNNNGYYSGLFDAPIIKQVGFAIIIAADAAWPYINPGTLFQIYRPLDIQTLPTFYEILTFPVLNPGTLAAKLANPTITLVNGDTYLIPRQIASNTNPATYPNNPVPGTQGSKAPNGFTYNTLICESASVSDFFQSQASDIGQPNVVDLFFRQKRYTQRLRFSDIIITDSETNGLCNFQGANYYDLPYEFGAIVKLIRSDIERSSVLLVLCTTQSVSMYVDENLLKTSQGTPLVSTNNAVLTSYSVQSGRYGCVNPESAYEHNGRIYFYSQPKAAVIRYSSDGEEAVSGGVQARGSKVQGYFKQLSSLIQSSPYRINVIMAYDQSSNELVLSWYGYNPSLVLSSNPTGIFGDTIAYNDDVYKHVGFSILVGTWVTRYSFLPEMMGKIDQTFLTFNNGNTWLNNDPNAPYMNYFGVQYAQTLTVVFNKNPWQVKMWKIVAYRANQLFSAIFTTPPTLNNPNGQTTNLLSTQFKNKEGWQYGAIMRDANTVNIPFPVVNGDEIRSEVLVVELTNINTTETYLQAIMAKGIDSALINKQQQQ